MARGGPGPVEPLGWSRGRPRRWGVLEVKQTCDYRLCLQLATLYLPTKVTIYRFFLLLSLSSLRIHHPVRSLPSLPLSLFHSSLFRLSVFLEHRWFVHTRAVQRKRERERNRGCTNCGWRLYSTPSSSIEDEEGEGGGGGGTGGAWNLGRNRETYLSFWVAT